MTALRWKEEWMPSLSEIISTWRDVQLSALQDETACDRILGNHETLKTGREKVRNLTKTFSHFDNEKKLSEFNSLLKEYQGYIDQLTGYLKDAERTYLEMFNRVKGIPDPYPLLKKLSAEMESVSKLIERAEACDASREEVHLLQVELQGLKDQEVTIERLRRELAEAKRNASLHAEQSAQDATVEYQVLLSQLQQQKHEMQQEIQSLRHEILKKNLSIEDLRNQVVELRASLEEVEAQRSRDIAELAVELEVSQSNLLKKEAEIQRLLATNNTNTGIHKNTLVSSAPAPILETHRMEIDDNTDVVSVPSKEEQVDNEFDLRVVEDPPTLIWEDQKKEIIQRCEGLQNELNILQEKYDEIIKSSGIQLRQKEEEHKRELAHVQELQNRLRSLNLYVDQLKKEKEQLSRAVQTLEGELNNLSKTSNYSSVDISLGTTSSTGRGEQVRVEIREKDDYSFEKLLSSTPTWQVGISDSVKKKEKNEEENEGQKEASPSLNDAEKDPFLIVASQRDKLRERLLTLNEVSSSQIHALKLEVANLTNENCTLRKQLSNFSNRDSSYSNGFGDSIFGIPILTGTEKDDGLQAKGGFPQLVDTSGGIFSRRTTLNILDYGAGVLSMRVFSTTVGRRSFVVYLALLHCYMVYCLLF
ncbi:uncharacterized protein TM35_000491160 [Trypanosoma theileri]|uniref:Cux N-terminal domain-containing protein n=1 Tax=Trypanosoma theileri TaxID=67003 RepID=A0A1X0NJ29_9TRYP|nr:uncharacterized protein TM35_000491160 [Trypanosoma theileri]ORC84110.1 hypothetical protein TM35_000491160 [Trypanosoma theileri]